MPAAKSTPAKADPEAKKPPAKAEPVKAPEPVKAEENDKVDPVEPTGVLNHADLPPVEQAKIREPLNA
jgi:hypothetical protein